MRYVFVEYVDFLLVYVIILFQPKLVRINVFDQVLGLDNFLSIFLGHCVKTLYVEVEEQCAPCDCHC